MEITLKELMELSRRTRRKRDDSHWEVGQSYFIRTVTHHFTGRLVKVTKEELVIEDAAWIADDGRFAQFVAGGEANEVEPYPDGAKVIIGRTSLIDAVRWSAKLPRTTK